MCIAFTQSIANTTQSPQQVRATSIPQVSSFITTMVNTHGFKKSELEFLFDNIILTVKQPVKNTTKNTVKPKKKHHKTTWGAFKKMFLTQQRIDDGVAFLKKHYKTLHKAEQQFGVQKAIIVAILGIETNYGKYTGNYPTMKTLTALAFGKNRRQQFYKKELEEFLLLARNNEIAPLSMQGSHAGAMGMSQFISSSYNHYAIDFNGDGVVDLFNVEDAIGSIANYFAKHYWQPGGRFALRVDNEYQQFATFGTNKPKVQKNITIPNVANDVKIAFISLKQSNTIETWATFWNFYVITRYNHDNKYAMATIELARAIIDKITQKS
jgi:membrane-bound lytic murein transglycosylase B